MIRLDTCVLTLSLFGNSRYARVTWKQGDSCTESNDSDGHCQDASTRSNLLPCGIDIAATFKRLICSEFNLFRSMPLLARYSRLRIAPGSSLLDFHHDKRFFTD